MKIYKLISNHAKIKLWFILIHTIIDYDEKNLSFPRVFYQKKKINIDSRENDRALLIPGIAYILSN